MSEQDRIDQTKLSHLILTSSKHNEQSCQSRRTILTGRSIFDRQYPVSRAKTPVAPIVLQNLPTTSTVEGACALKDCAICKEELRTKAHSTAARLPCSHVFHPQCITQWLQEHDTCPICRFSMPTLCHFTTPRSLLSKPPVTAAPLQPPVIRRSTLQQQSSDELFAMYRSWVISTYHHQQLPINIPSEVASDDKDALISYLAECRVIRLLAEEP
jgi:Ring finger domain